MSDDQFPISGPKRLSLYAFFKSDRVGADVDVVSERESSPIVNHYNSHNKYSP